MCPQPEIAHRRAHKAAGEVGAASRKRDAAHQPVAIEHVHRLAAHLEGARAVPVPCALRSGQHMVVIGCVSTDMQTAGGLRTGLWHMLPCMAAAALSKRWMHDR